MVMRRSASVVPLLLIAALAIGSGAARVAAQVPAPARAAAPVSVVTVIKAMRLFDGTGDAAIADGVVIVEGSRIKAVGSRLAVPEGATVIDLGDATLLPGFIDCHTHLTHPYVEDWLAGTMAQMRRTTAEKAIRSTLDARAVLDAGFTTVRDVGSSEYLDVGLRNAINDGLVPGPRMLVAVHALGARGGHADETGFPFGTFGAEPGIERGIAAGADNFRDAVRFQVKYGADVIKVCATGGVLSLADAVDTPQITQMEMYALVDEAHRLGKTTAAHAHGVEGARTAIRAGIDSIEHGSFLDEPTLAMMKQRGTFLVPTLLAGEYVSGRAAVRHFPPEIAAKAKAAIEARSVAVKLAVSMGVRIAFGTDSAVGPHGANAQEFALMVEHGMTPAAALRAATRDAAILMRLTKTTGSVEVGKEADLVAVPGDVLADIRATERVMFVMKGGRVHRRAP